MLFCAQAASAPLSKKKSGVRIFLLKRFRWHINLISYRILPMTERLGNPSSTITPREASFFLFIFLQVCKTYGCYIAVKKKEINSFFTWISSFCKASDVSSHKLELKSGDSIILDIDFNMPPGRVLVYPLAPEALLYRGVPTGAKALLKCFWVSSSSWTHLKKSMNTLTVSLRRPPPSYECLRYNTKQFNGWGSSNAGTLGNAEYIFIAITYMSPLHLIRSNLWVK